MFVTRRVEFRAEKICICQNSSGLYCMLDIHYENRKYIYIKEKCLFQVINDTCEIDVGFVWHGLGWVGLGQWLDLFEDWGWGCGEFRALGLRWDLGDHWFWFQIFFIKKAHCPLLLMFFYFDVSVRWLHMWFPQVPSPSDWNKCVDIGHSDYSCE